MDATIQTIGICAMALVYVVSYQLITQKVGNPKRVKEINANFKQIQKDLDAAMKSKDDTEIQKIVKRQEAAMPTMFEMMFLMYKPLIAVIPLLILLSNPQLNFNESAIFAWPQNATASSQIDAKIVAAGMGLPADSTSVHFVNASIVEVNSNGQAAARFEHSENGFVHYTDIAQNHSFIVHTRNESGIEALYYPSVRIRNPVAVQNMFAGFVIKLPFQLPIVIQNFDRFPNWRDTFGPNGWFWICVVFGGLGVSIIKSINDKKDEAKQKGEGSSPPLQAKSN